MEKNTNKYEINEIDNSQIFNQIELIYNYALKLTINALSHYQHPWLKYINLSQTTKYFSEILLSLYHFNKSKIILLPEEIQLNPNSIIYQVMRSICKKTPKEITNLQNMSRNFMPNFTNQNNNYSFQINNRTISFQRIIANSNDHFYQFLLQDPYVETSCFKYNFIDMLFPRQNFPDIPKERQVITSFIAYPIAKCGFIHTYLESDNTIYDLTGNLKMSKEDFDYLLKPQEISRLDHTYFENLNKRNCLITTNTGKVFNYRHFFLDPDHYLQENPEFLNSPSTNTKKKIPN